MEITRRAAEFAAPSSAQPPVRALTAVAVAALHDELLAYHRECAPLFHRTEPRHWALKYLAEALAGGTVQALQHRPGGTRRRRGLGGRRGAGQAPAAGGGAPGRRGHRGAAWRRVRLPQAGGALGRRRPAPPRGHPAGRSGRWPTARRAWWPPPSGHPTGARGFTRVDRRRFVHADWCTAAYATRRRRGGVPPDRRVQPRPARAGCCRSAG